MKKINDQILSIPPYISTAWKNVDSIYMNGSSLHVALHTGTKVEIPDLEKTTIEEIFSAHSKYLNNGKGQTSLNFIMPGLENMGMFMQHNMNQSDAPDLPPEVLEKISNLTRSLDMGGEMSQLPKAEPHCNCPYCQIARAIHAEQEEEIEEEVSDEELTFRAEWDIEQVGDKLYKVTNPLNTSETFQVFLGEPLGCTCGHNNCVHIQSVLNT